MPSPRWLTTPAEIREALRVARPRTRKANLVVAHVVAEALRATGDLGMQDEADALVVAIREWNRDSADEYGVETPRDLILASLDTLERFLAAR